MNTIDQKPSDDNILSEQVILQELAGPRQLVNWQMWLLFAVALCWSLFQLSLGSILLLNSTLVRSIHLAFALFIVFITYPAFKSRPGSKFYDGFTQLYRFGKRKAVISILILLTIAYFTVDFCFSNIPFIEKGDINKPAKLISDLRNPDDPLSKSILDIFPSRTKDLLARHTIDDQPSDSLLVALYDDLNRLLHRSDFYELEGLSRISTDRDWTHLVELNSEGEALQLRNRMLLEAAYPGTIDPSRFPVPRQYVLLFLALLLAVDMGISFRITNKRKKIDLFVDLTKLAIIITASITALNYISNPYVLLSSDRTVLTGILFVLILIALMIESMRCMMRDRFHILELVMAIVATIAALYIALDYTGIAERIGLPIPRDTVFGILLIVLLLEAARRVVGPALSILATLFAVYAFFGPYMPSIISHGGISLDRFLSQITMSTEGIYGVPLGVSANIVFLFVLFGTMLEKAGGGNYFIQLSTALLGSFRGGPAKAAILSSGMTGMINGSSIANVVTTGTFTIPLMKSVGYPAKKAGAIEVASSVGGQLMPPIMGAAAFIMAEYVNLPYIEVVKAAFLPAFVAYAALFYISHLEACKLGLRGLRKEEKPRFIPTFLSGLHYLIPIVVLIYKLVYLRHTPESSAFLAIIALTMVMLVQDPIKALLSGKPIFPAIWTGITTWLSSLVAGARNNVTVAIATASAGIIVGVVTMGLGGMITELVAYISGGNLYLMLVITAIASLMLGMGLPTTANYIVMASLTAPIIVTVGGAAGFVVPLMAAHLFVFYFGILADDTPPVGLAAYAAAAIARSNPISTGIQGFIYDIRTAILPFMFIFNTELILWGVDSWLHGVFLFITAAGGGMAFASATQGWLITRNKWYETIGLLAITLMVFQPQIGPRLVGIEVDFRFRPQDLHHARDFGKELLKGDDAISRMLGNSLSPVTKRVLAASESKPDSAAYYIANDLNRRLEDGTLNKDHYLQGFAFSEDVQRLMEAQKSSEHVVRLKMIKLNRMILHEVYPEYIALSRLSSIERQLGFHPKYFTYLVAAALCGLIFLTQRMRVLSVKKD